MMKTHLSRVSRTAVVMLGLLVPFVHAAAAGAQTADQTSVNRAHDFLKSEKRGRNVLSYVHFGAQYKGHTFVERRGVNNQPAHFALVYRMNWENDGVTNVAFLCDGKGSVYEVQILGTNAI